MFSILRKSGRPEVRLRKKVVLTRIIYNSYQSVLRGASDYTIWKNHSSEPFRLA